MTGPIDAIGARLAAGEPLSDRDAEALLASPDLVTIGMLADHARQRKHGRRTTFVRVFELPIDAAPPTSHDPIPEAAGEVRLVGTPTSVDGAESAVRRVAALTGGRPLSGFSLDDLKALARHSRISLEALGRHLREAGLEFIADVPVDQIDEAPAAIEAVVRAGLGTPRLTVARPDASHPLAAIRRAVEVQRATGAARAFAPLPRVIDPAAPSTGYDDVKRVALARLLADNIDSIQVDWELYGPKLAQVALTFGADDIDRVSPVDRPELGPRRVTLEEILRNIRAASLEPVPRDGRFVPAAS